MSPSWIRYTVYLLVLLSLPLSASLHAADDEGAQIVSGYLARLPQHSATDLENALRRAERLFVDGQLMDGHEPVTFVVHGPEVSVFFRDNYDAHKPLLDLAAKLTAFQVIDIRICETRMGVLGRDKSVLVPFVGTVPFGPAEEERLLADEAYIYF